MKANTVLPFYLQSDEPGNAEMWQRGLQGQGQVVAVGDTGLDFDHCFFYDADHDVPLNTVNTEHRKIIRFTHVHTVISRISYPR